MIAFKHKKKNIIIITNYKIMSTTLHDFSDVEMVKRRVLLIHWFFKKKYFFLVRNPYDRLYSFYNNKLKKDLRKPVKGLQKCQKIFIPHLNGLGENSSIESIQKCLYELSFDDFIRILPKIYSINTHLTLQCWKKCSSSLLLNKIIFKLIKHKLELFKLEDPIDLQNFSQKIGLNSKDKKNSTQEIPKLPISKESLEIINSIYKDDFLELGYKMKTTKNFDKQTQ